MPEAHLRERDPMSKHWLKLASLLLLGSSVLLAEQWTGWLVDQNCARAGDKSKFTGDVHKKHVEDGEPLVFVGEADGKIHTLVSPDRVKAMTGQKVLLKGNLNPDGSIEAQSAEKAAVTALTPTQIP